MPQHGTSRQDRGPTPPTSPAPQDDLRVPLVIMGIIAGFFVLGLVVLALSLWFG